MDARSTPDGRATRLALALVATIALVTAVDGGAGAQSARPTDPSARDRQAGGPPAFTGSSSAIDPGLRARMKGISWRRGCPVPIASLRLLELTYWGFDGAAHQGRLVVHRDAAAAILGVMEALYRERFPIRRMRLIDAYGGADRKSMAADNTSAFNCRFVAGRPGVWSQHAYGRAIDLNPIENPYVTGSGHVSPPAGKKFAKRSRRAPGMIHAGDAVVHAFAARGWEWGGNWPWPKDYQHFSATGS
jgi:D-alanyl-D-alanine carboxypeptidase